jgi:hypothetical protein
MKKNLIKPTAEVKTITGTKYVLLPDGRVAKPLKPMEAHGTVYYNLFIEGEYTRLSTEKIAALVNGETTVQQLKA